MRLIKAEGYTWVCRVSAASQNLLKTKEVLLAHGAWLPVILPASQFGELEGDDLQEEEGVWVCPVPLIGSSGGDDASLKPGYFLRGLGNEAGIAEDAGSNNAWDG